jgi:predicted O-methyltransferase YrrM
VRRPRIEGWTADDEAEELSRLAGKAGRALEVGAWKGFGTVLMAQAGAQVWAVDWHRGDADLGATDTMCAWWTNIRRAGVEDQVVGLVGRSEVVLRMLREQTFDLAFIDGSHGRPSVDLDIVNTLPLMARGGVLAFHDYSPTWPGVVGAVDDLSRALALPIRRVNTLAVIQLK